MPTPSGAWPGHKRPGVKPIAPADWSAQRQRISRDLVLSAELLPCVVVTTTQGLPDQRREMLALPLDTISGFLFGINADRVKPLLPHLA